MKSIEKVLRLSDEVWNAHDLDAVDKLFADDVVLATGRQKRAPEKRTSRTGSKGSSTRSMTWKSTLGRHSRIRTAPGSRPDGC